MDIKQIEQVIEIVHSGSFSRAAQALYISQPNLSYSVKALETELGYSIFERVNTGIKLTDSGRQFLDYARPVYEQFKLLKSICVGQTNRPTLSVSASPLKFVSNVFIDLYRKHAETGAALTYHEDTLLHTFENVESSIADIGIILFPSFQKKTWLRLARLKHLDYHMLSSEPPHVILGKHNPLYSQEISQVSFHDMLPYSYIGCYPGLFDGCDEQSSLAQHLFMQKQKGELTISHRAMLYSLLKRTSAYSITSNNQNAYEKQPAYSNIKAIPIKDPGFSFEIGWVTKHSRESSPLVKEFISALCATLKLNQCQGECCKDTKEAEYPPEPIPDNHKRRNPQYVKI